MGRTKILSFALVLALLLSASVGVHAVEVESGSIYCFSAGDFSREAGELMGICITELPDPKTGTVMLGNRVIRCGDILTADQVAQMTFAPLQTQEDTQAVVRYLPVFQDRVEQVVEMTISIRGRENKAPVVEDLALETYKNLENTGKLKVSDPEGEEMTYTVTRHPRRGAVEIASDGTFTYAPAKNKVGVDSFTFTATDSQGNVSREATVTVRILKPSEGKPYQDTVGYDCRFEAEWLRNSGLFEGEKVGSRHCFYPEKAVSNQEFLTMVMELLEIEPQQQEAYGMLTSQVPDWLKPYVAAAVRSGLLSDGAEYTPDAPITGAEAAAILQNAMDLEVFAQDGRENPVVAVMNENGFFVEAESPLTRADAAKLLYRLSKTDTAGLAVYRNQ